jgi:hypothetical protein
MLFYRDASRRSTHLCFPLGLQADHSHFTDLGGMEATRRKIETVPGSEGDLPILNAKGD